MEKDDAKEDAKANKYTFTNRVLCNKRIWKLIALYAFVYATSRKIFDPWYKVKPKVSVSQSIQALSSMDTNRNMIEGVIGRDAHKPSTNMAILVNQIILNYLFFFKAKPSWKSYAFATEQEIIDSTNPKNTNNDFINNCYDVHLAIWSCLSFIDVYNCYKTGKMNKSDKMMICHHVGIFFFLLIGCLKGKGFDVVFAYGTFWLENTAIIAMLASLFRVIYQKKRRDLMILRHISDLLFFIHGLVFTYARIGLAPLQTRVIWKYLIKDERNQFTLSYRTFFFFAYFILKSLSIYWVFLMWKVMATKLFK